MLKKIICGFLVALGIGMCSAVTAATLQVNSGELTGATGVNVGGSYYDVTFQDGSCNSLFSGCSSFTFTTQADAQAAATALLTQVFLDGVQGLFDSQPYSTAGCSVSAFCNVATLYNSNGDYVGALNFPVETSDAIHYGGILPSISLSPDGYATFAVWTAAPVPEPEIYAMLGLGLGLMGWVGRRRKQQTA